MRNGGSLLAEVHDGDADLKVVRERGDSRNHSWRVDQSIASR
jgi:hypothetical protein